MTRRKVLFCSLAALAALGDGELYVLTKGDGMIREIRTVR